MQIAQYVDAIDTAGTELAAAAERAGLDAAVPTCPEWTVRDLVRHTGYVHRWAATYVRQGRATVLDDDEEEAAVGPLPGDGELIAWFRAGHAALLDTLRTAPADLACWTFLRPQPPVSPLTFWARRQAHETIVHRVDVEGALGGGKVTAVSAELGTDGIDELLMGFYARKGGRLRAQSPVRLLVEPVDSAAAWTVRIGPDGAAPTRERLDADCVLRGSASDLYLALWNRRSTDDLDVHGDRAVLELWRERATVRWT